MVVLDHKLTETLFPDSAEHDTNLVKHFIATGSFRKVLNLEKLIVVGRKGSGKSAIYRYLQSTSDIQYVKLTPDQFSLEIFDHYVKSSGDQILTGLTGFSAAWKTVILHTISDFLKGKTTDNSDDIVSTSVALLRSWSQTNVDFKSIHAVANGDLSSVVSCALKNGEYDIDFNLINNFLASKILHVLIDDLDYVWQDSTLGASYIYGLIAAAQSLSQERNLFLTLFLREDMFTTIQRQYHRIDNIRHMIEPIDWNPQLLKNMISKRIQTYFDIGRDGWSTLFPEKVREYDSFKYMIERTQLRPREILQYCRISYETAAAYKKSKVEGPDIEQAERTYSRWKLDDLCSEYSTRYINLIALFEAFSIARIRISRTEILNIISGVLDRGLIRRYFKDDPTPLTEEEILKFLYECGFLRARVLEGGKDRFKVSNTAPLLNLNFIENFDIHPAYRRILNGH